jgi:hypothetical protein
VKSREKAVEKWWSDRPKSSRKGRGKRESGCEGRQQKRERERETGAVEMHGRWVLVEHSKNRMSEEWEKKEEGSVVSEEWGRGVQDRQRKRRRRWGEWKKSGGETPEAG